MSFIEVSSGDAPGLVNLQVDLQTCKRVFRFLESDDPRRKRDRAVSPPTGGYKSATFDDRSRDFLTAISFLPAACGSIPKACKG